MKVDYTTYCNSDSKAGVNLAKILEEYSDKNLTKGVLKTIHKFFIAAKSLEKLEGHYEFYFRLLYQETRKNIVTKKLPEKVESHTLCFIDSYFKKSINSRKQNESKN